MEMNAGFLCLDGAGVDVVSGISRNGNLSILRDIGLPGSEPDVHIGATGEFGSVTHLHDIGLVEIQVTALTGGEVEITAAGKINILRSGDDNPLDILGDILEREMIEGGSTAEIGRPVCIGLIMSCIGTGNQNVGGRVIGSSRSILNSRELHFE